MNIKTKHLIEEILKNDDRLWNQDKTELNQTLLLDLVEKIDEKCFMVRSNYEKFT